MKLSDADLEALLNDLESDRAERKKTFSGDAPEKSRQAICAFANDLPNYQRPGVVFIGANHDGSPSGLVVTDELLRQLADIRTDGAIGAYSYAVQEAYKDYQALAKKILERIGLREEVTTC